MSTTSLPSSSSGLRISLRAFLLLVAAFSAGCAALKYANEFWLAGVLLIALAAFIACAIVALVDRGRRQAAALGFVAAMAIYLALLSAMRVPGDSAGEFDPGAGKLPTSLALRPLFSAIRVIWFVDPSGTRIQESDLPPGALNPGGSYLHAGEAPLRGHFMRIGHCLWALLFGYAGAHFARFVYARRVRVQHAPAGPLSTLRQ